ncbi:hypothetical protein E2R51_17010 [Jeotgalibacillus sp. S-D1]|nr:hypothetical protein E2R51_17010 [Jeotgalibacillus sp. S-D1]
MSVANHTDQCDKIIDYFNGHLTEEEKDSFELHLANCSECQAELAEWNALIDELPYDSEPVSPPEGMKERILGNLFEDSDQDSDKNEKPVLPIAPIQSDKKTVKKKSRPSKWMVPAAAALLLSLGGNFFLYNELQEQSAQLGQSQDTIDELLQFVTLTPADEGGNAAGTASIVRNGSEVNVVINASSLGPLNEDEVYQVWLIEGETPQRAGTFKSSETGEGTVVFTLDNFNPDQWNQIAVSHEPDASSETPEGSVVLSSEL